MAFLFDPHYQAMDANGDPLSGAKLYFFQTGTATAITTYQDSGLSTPHASPVVADASGRFAPIYLNTSPFKFRLDTSADVVVQTVDPAYGGFDGFVTAGSDIASASTINLDTATGPFVDITGTTSVTTVTLTEGRVRIARAAGAFTLTASSTLIVNGSTTVSYQTAAGELLLFQGDASSVVRVWVVGPNGDPVAFPAGHLHGLTLSNNSTDATNDIDIATGSCRDSTDAINMTLASALTKRLDAGWSAGTGNGMRNSAASITDTTYHIYVVAKAGGADADVYAHTSATVATVITALQAETGGSDYVYARRIGSIIRSSSAIRGFVQNGDTFLLKVPFQDVDITNLGTSATSLTLASVPSGIQVYAYFFVNCTNGGANYSVLISSLDQTDTAPVYGGVGTIMGFVDNYNGTSLQIRTNTTSQIRARSSAANTIVDITTNGWIDRRGQDA